MSPPCPLAVSLACVGAPAASSGCSWRSGRGLLALSTLWMSADQRRPKPMTCRAPRHQRQKPTSRRHRRRTAQHQMPGSTKPSTIKGPARALELSRSTTSRRSGCRTLPLELAALCRSSAPPCGAVDMLYSGTASWWAGLEFGCCSASLLCVAAVAEVVAAVAVSVVATDNHQRRRCRLRLAPSSTLHSRRCCCYGCC